MKPLLNKEINKEHPYIILGAGGHAKVIIDILRSLNCHIAGIISPTIAEGSFFKGIKYLGSDKILKEFTVEKYYFVNALGSINNTFPRTQLFQLYSQYQCIFPKIIHPQAVISKSAIIKNGVHILAGSIIGPDVKINENVIINTQSIIEHDCVIGSHSHVASGATLCGNINIGNNVHIGAGSTINQDLSIGDSSVIASGAVVTQNIGQNCLAAGVPAKIKSSNYFNQDINYE